MSNPRSRQIATRAALVALALVGLIAATAYRSYRPGHRARPAATAASTRRDLAALRSLPYAAWSAPQPEAEASRGGVVVHDAARAWDGYNLYTDDRNTVYLMDMSGTRRHTWSVPGGRHCEHAELVEAGYLMVICERQSLVKLDWDSRVVWKLAVPVHHDLAAKGPVYLTPRYTRPRLYRGRWVNFDAIMTVTRRGQKLGLWHTFDHLEALRGRHGPTVLDEPPADGAAGTGQREGPDPSDEVYDYYHLNTVEVLPDTPLGRADRRFRAGNVLICLRNTSTLAILDGDTSEIVWHWGPGVLDFPHMPTMLPTGHILVFDNGKDRDFSRVLEIAPDSGRIVWSYVADPPQAFHSLWRGSNQRLPNGNTLIGEAERGRAFEVTPGGAIVWEFLNPQVRGRRRHLIYRMMRYPRSVIDPLLVAGTRRGS